MLLLLSAALPAQAAEGLARGAVEKFTQENRHKNIVTIQQIANATLETRVSLWKKLQQPGATPFQTYLVFMSENPTWPAQSAIQLQAEASLNDQTPNAQILEFFGARPPLTPAGMIRYGQALMAAGKPDVAEKSLADFFLSRDFSADSMGKIGATFPGVIKSEDILARIDRLIWQEKFDLAAEFTALLPPDLARMPRARIAMLQQKKEADLFFNQLTDAEQNDTAVLFARARLRRALGYASSAAGFLGKIDTFPGREEELAKERHALARLMITEGNHTDAFNVVAGQTQCAGQHSAQALWLAGWLALRFEKDLPAASKFFKMFNDQVQTPVSRSRGAYWLARTAEAAGQPEVANQWYQVSAQYGPTFYGQLASEKLGQPLVLPPRLAESIHDKILHDERIQAAQILLRQNDTANAKLFFRSVLNGAAEQMQFAALANWANQKHQPHWAVLASKAAQQKGFIGLRAGYPIMAKNLRDTIDSRLSPALAHAITRQESEFDTTARSVSNAQGLMQLLPGTAKEVARKTRTTYAESALIHNPAKNVKWGSYYLANQVENFSNEYLAIAAYNAGPNRVRQWMQTYGDPRREGTDWVDWIEGIPSYETRTYVQRVTENEKVYAALMIKSAAE